MSQKVDSRNAQPEAVKEAVLDNSDAIENAPYLLAKSGEIGFAASSGSGSSSRLRKPE